MNLVNKTNIQHLIDLALNEDIGGGDYTTLSCVPASKQESAIIKSKEIGVVAGLEIAKQVFQTVDENLQVKLIAKDGDLVKERQILMEIKGSAQSILTGERVALNFLQRLSGIATATNKISTMIAHTKCKVLDTRKTTPAWRLLEKWAVSIGGGVNHRIGLYDMVLIKDNHIDYAGGMKQALDNCHLYLKKNKLSLDIEVEVRNFDELEQLLALGGAQRVLIDNFSPADVSKAVKLVKGSMVTEASGNININTAVSYAEAGVDYISMGSLTHSVRALDISLDVGSSIQ